MQEVHGVADLLNRNIAASADVSLTVLLLRADIEQYGALCSPAAV